MQPRKILQIIRPAEGGMKEHVLALARGLDKSLFEVGVACPTGISLADELRTLGVKVFDIPLVGPISLKRDFACIKALKTLCQNERFDLVHCHGSKAGLVGRVGAILGDIPNIVLTAHNFVIDQAQNPFKNFIFVKGEQVLGAKTNKFITVSSALREEYINKFEAPPDKIVCIYNGIELQLFEPVIDKEWARLKLGLKPKLPVIGTVARMAPQKGLSYFLDAISYLTNEIEAQYLVVGDGPLREELENQARILGIDKQVKFTGFCEEILPILKAIDIFVIPSISEGLSITAIEAMAAGLPVIASRVGGLPEVVVDNQTGLLVKPHDGKVLAEAIKSLVLNPERAIRMGSRGKITAGEKFGLTKMIRETEKVYKELLLFGH